MKQIGYLIMCLITTLFISCGSATKKQNEDPQKVYKLLSVIDEYVQSHPDLMNNKLTKEKGASEIQQKIIDAIEKDSSILFEIPLEYEMTLRQAENSWQPNYDKFIIKFSLSSLGKDAVGNDKSVLSFMLFSIVTEDVVLKLKENKRYLINGHFKGSASGKIKLPSGNIFQKNPYIGKEAIGSRTNYDLGAFYVEDIVFEEYHKETNTTK